MTRFDVIFILSGVAGVLVGLWACWTVFQTRRRYPDAGGSSMMGSDSGNWTSAL